MKHVFVETNWVVAYAAPEHQRLPAALSLAQRAADGELRLYLPSVCLTEARYPIRSKFHPRLAADPVRAYLKWAVASGRAQSDDVMIVRRVLDQYERTVAAELRDLDERLQSLLTQPGIEVFALRSQMLDRAVELANKDLDLKPFDQAILVRAEALRDEGANDISFCELDRDLQPWDKDGRAKQPLAALYDVAHTWVYGDFALENPPKPTTFPE